MLTQIVSDIFDLLRLYFGFSILFFMWQNWNIFVPKEIFEDKFLSIWNKIIPYYTHQEPTDYQVLFGELVYLCGIHASVV